MPIKAIEPPRLYRQVADQLRLLIDNGEYPVGARLPAERELAEKFGLSRPTVREALIALEVEGRVRIRVGSGIYVTSPPLKATLVGEDEVGPFEHMQAREFVEGAIAAEAALQALPEDVERVDEVLARMAQTKLSTSEILMVDRQFHTTVAGILGNAVLVRFVGELFDQRTNPFYQRLSTHFEGRESWQAALEEHGAVRDAIAAHDAAEAKAAMQRHLRHSQMRFSQSFGETPVVPENAQ